MNDQDSQMDSVDNSLMESLVSTNNLDSCVNENIANYDTAGKMLLKSHYSIADKMLLSKKNLNYKEYDPYEIPPNLVLCELHERCNAIGKIDISSKKNVCPCCAQVESDPIPICNNKFNSDDLRYFGSGYPLYLKMIKFTMFLIIFPLIFKATLNIIINVNGNSCMTKKEIRANIENSIHIFKEAWFNYKNDTKQAQTPKNLYFENQTLRKLANENVSNKKKYLGIFDPDKELAQCQDERPLLMFMKFHCFGRGKDDVCDRYKDQKCDEGFRIKKTDDKMCKKIAFSKKYIQNLEGSCEMVSFPYFMNLSIGNTMKTHSDIQNSPVWYISNYLTMFFLWIMVQIWAVYYRYKNEDYDRKTKTPKDYTVLIKGLPKHIDAAGFNMKDIIKDSIEKENLICGEAKLRVETVSCVYNTQEYSNKIDKLERFKTELAKEQYKNAMNILEKKEERKKNKEKIDKFNKEIIQINYDLRQIEENFGGNLTKEFTGQAFVSFKFENERDTFLNKYKKKGCCWIYFGYNPKIENVFQLHEFNIQHQGYAIPAPEPNDVCWESLNYKTKEKTCRFVLSQLFGLILLTMNFFAILFSYMVSFNYTIDIRDKKGSHKENTTKFVNYLWVYFPPVLTFIINLLTTMTITQQAKLSKPRTITGVTSYVAKVDYKVKIFNATMAPVLSTFTTLLYFNSTGLIVQTTRFMFLNIILNNALQYFDYRYYLKEIKKYFIKKNITNGPEIKKVITQQEAMLTWEKLDWDMTTNVTYFYSNLGYAMFFLPFIPLIGYLSLLAIFIEFWIDWYILVRRTNSIKSYSSEIGEMFAYEYEFCMIIYALGVLTSETLMRYMNNVGWVPSIGSIFMFVFTVVNYYLEKRWLRMQLYDWLKPCIQSYNSVVLKKRPLVFDINLTPFDKVQQLYDDYDLFNPVYKRQSSARNVAKLRVDRKTLAEAERDKNIGFTISKLLVL